MLDDILGDTCSAAVGNTTIAPYFIGRKNIENRSGNPN